MMKHLTCYRGNLKTNNIITGHHHAFRGCITKNQREYIKIGEKNEKFNEVIMHLCVNYSKNRRNQRNNTCCNPSTEKITCSNRKTTLSKKFLIPRKISTIRFAKD